LLVGLPLAGRSQRGERSVEMVGTLGILVSYYLILTTLEGMAIRERLPVWLAIWMPNILFGAIGAALLGVTAREWRAPHLRTVWRVIDVVWQRGPRRRARRAERFTATARDTTLIIDRYLIRQFLTFIGIGLAVTSALFIVVDLLQTLDKYLRVKPPLIYIFEHFLYALPVALHQGLPIVM